MKFPTEDQYPKKVYASGEAYSVSFVKDMADYGETDSEKQTIKIKSGMAPREIFYTFIHEVLHCLEFEHGIKVTHAAVYKYEKAIAEFLIDNF